MEDVRAEASNKEHMVMIAKYHESANELFTTPCLIADTEASVTSCNPGLRRTTVNGVVRCRATATNWDGEQEGRWPLLYSAMLVTGSSIVCWALVIAGMRALIS